MNRFLILFFTLLSFQALASKARMQSLGNSLHLIDPQTIFANPIDLISLENFVSLEGGPTAATSALNGAEGIISYGFKGNQRIALAFGHQDPSIVDSRNLINLIGSTPFEMAQNPLYIFYSMEDSLTSWAIGVSYSGKDDKVAGLAEKSIGVSGGVELGNLQFNSLYIFTNSVDAAGGKQFDGGGYWQSTLSYLLENTMFELAYTTSKAKLSTTTGSVIQDDELHVKNVISLGLADVSPRDGNHFFWGAQVTSTTLNCKIDLSVGCDKAYTQTVLPAWFGVETEIADWLIFRGSVKQSFLISITKDEFGYPASVVNGATGTTSNLAAAANDTVVSSGLGFRFKELTIDGSLASSTTQSLNLNNFLSQVGLTYKF